MTTHTPSTESAPGQSAGGASGSVVEQLQFAQLDRMCEDVGGVENMMGLFGAWLDDLMYGAPE